MKNKNSALMAVLYMAVGGDNTRALLLAYITISDGYLVPYLERASYMNGFFDGCRNDPFWRNMFAQGNVTWDHPTEGQIKEFNDNSTTDVQIIELY